MKGKSPNIDKLYVDLYLSKKYHHVTKPDVIKCLKIVSYEDSVSYSHLDSIAKTLVRQSPYLYVMPYEIPKRGSTTPTISDFKVENDTLRKVYHDSAFLTSGSNTMVFDFNKVLVLKLPRYNSFTKMMVNANIHMHQTYESSYAPIDVVRLVYQRNTQIKYIEGLLQERLNFNIPNTILTPLYTLIQKMDGGYQAKISDVDFIKDKLKNPSEFIEMLYQPVTNFGIGMDGYIKGASLQKPRG